MRVKSGGEKRRNGNSAVAKHRALEEAQRQAGRKPWELREGGTEICTHTLEARTDTDWCHSNREKSQVYVAWRWLRDSLCDCSVSDRECILASLRPELCTTMNPDTAISDIVKTLHTVQQLRGRL